MEPAQANRDKRLSEDGLCHLCDLHTNLTVTTKQRIRAEPQIIKKENTSTENPQNEMVVRNTKEEKQWKYRLGGIKPSCINNHSKCKSIEFSNQQTQSGGVDQKTRPNNMLPPGNTSQL